MICHDSLFDMPHLEKKYLKKIVGKYTQKLLKNTILTKYQYKTIVL